MKNKKQPVIKKVLVAMSGGVDSSVAALILKKQGYEVIGAFMKNWSDSKDDLGQCTWIADRKEAVKIASKLKIPLITLDFEKEYRKLIVSEMYKLYKKGITPNPDVDCNNKIKFPLLWKAAKLLKADFIATGHYVKIKGKSLYRADDESKDQSYFLYRLTASDLSHTLFPIGNLTKKRVRQIAKRNKFPNFDRKGTRGICFIGKVNLKKFLQKKIKPKRGKILSPEGEQIGQHDGIFYYTIGQRLGPRFGIDVNKSADNRKQLKRWYVASKDRKTNTIIAAPEGHKALYRKEMVLNAAHWIDKAPTKNKTTKVHARIRQVGELLPATLSYKKGMYNVKLKKTITGVSEGQACVLYKRKKVIGGGVITR